MAKSTSRSTCSGFLAHLHRADMTKLDVIWREAQRLLRVATSTRHLRNSTPSIEAKWQRTTCSQENRQNMPKTDPSTLIIHKSNNKRLYGSWEPTKRTHIQKKQSHTEESKTKLIAQIRQINRHPTYASQAQKVDTQTRTTVCSHARTGKIKPQEARRNPDTKNSNKI